VVGVALLRRGGKITEPMKMREEICFSKGKGRRSCGRREWSFTFRKTPREKTFSLPMRKILQQASTRTERNVRPEKRPEGSRGEPTRKKPFLKGGGESCERGGGGGVYLDLGRKKTPYKVESRG